MKKTTLAMSVLLLVLASGAPAADERPSLGSAVDASAESVEVSLPLPSAAEEAASSSAPAADCSTDRVLPSTILEELPTESASGPAVCGSCSFGGCANQLLASLCFVPGGTGQCLPVFPDNLQCPEGDGFWCACVGGF